MPEKIKLFYDSFFPIPHLLMIYNNSFGDLWRKGGTGTGPAPNILVSSLSVSLHQSSMLLQTHLPPTPH
jgi:hypothetical protein